MTAWTPKARTIAAESPIVDVDGDYWDFFSETYLEIACEVTEASVPTEVYHCSIWMSKLCS